MTEPLYQIVFRGKILTGYTREQVRANLAQLFRTDPARIDALLDAPKTVLKTGISKEAATRYQEALRQAGIMVAMMAEVPITAAAEAATAAPPPPAPLQRAPAERASEQPPAAAAVAPSPSAPPRTGLTLAAPGERIIPEQTRVTAQINTSGLTLAPAAGPLIDAKPIAAPQFDLSGISIATDTGPIDRSPKASPLQIDTSALSLDAPPPAKPDTGLSELQKLLSSSVD